MKKPSPSSMDEGARYRVVVRGGDNVNQGDILTYLYPDPGQPEDVGWFDGSTAPRFAAAGEVPTAYVPQYWKNLEQVVL